MILKVCSMVHIGAVLIYIERERETFKKKANNSL